MDNVNKMVEKEAKEYSEKRVPLDEDNEDVYMNGVYPRDVRDALELAYQKGFTSGHAAGLEEAARIVDTWHFKKGGYSELAHQVRALKDQSATKGDV